MRDLLIIALATWRLASLLVNEDGPYEIFARLRYRVGLRSVPIFDPDTGVPSITVLASNTWAKGLTCVWCTSIWCSILLYGVSLIAWPVVYVLAVSAVAILVHEVTQCLRSHK
jgi:hypothetical protein